MTGTYQFTLKILIKFADQFEELVAGFDFPYQLTKRHDIYHLTVPNIDPAAGTAIYDLLEAHFSVRQLVWKFESAAAYCLA